MIKKALFFIFTGFLIFSVQAQAQSDSEPEIFVVKLTEPLIVNTGQVIKATLTGLTQEAKNLGFDKVVLSGSVRWEGLSPVEYRAYVSWETVGSESISGFSSQFTTDDRQVETGQELNVQGNIERLTNALYTVADNLTVTPASANVSPQKTPNYHNNTESSNSTTPSGFSGSSGFNGSSDSGNLDEITENKPESPQKKQVDCTPEINHEKRRVSLRSKTVITDALTGQITDEGECTDTGETIPFQRVYSETGCPVVISYADKKAYVQYTEHYLNEKSEKVEVTPCSNDYEKFYTLKATNEGCGVRSDFVEKKSYLQEKFQYTNSTGQTVDATTCKDSNASFNHFLTDKTCSPEFVDNQVFLFKRWAFTDSSGVISYISDCEPIKTGTVPIQTELCEKQFFHDFNSKQSFQMSRRFYVDDQGIKHYLTDCLKDTSKAYPHKNTTEDCQITFDDPNLVNIINYKTVINTENGIAQVAGCGAKTSKIQYKRQRNEKTVRTRYEKGKKGNYYFNVPERVSQVYLTLSHTPGRINRIVPVKPNSSIPYAIDVTGVFWGFHFSKWKKGWSYTLTKPSTDTQPISHSKRNEGSVWFDRGEIIIKYDNPVYQRHDGTLFYPEN